MVNRDETEPSRPSRPVQGALLTCPKNGESLFRTNRRCSTEIRRSTLTPLQLTKSWNENLGNLAWKSSQASPWNRLLAGIGPGFTIGTVDGDNGGHTETVVADIIASWPSAGRGHIGQPYVPPAATGGHGPPPSREFSQWLPTGQAGGAVRSPILEATLLPRLQSTRFGCRHPRATAIASRDHGTRQRSRPGGRFLLERVGLSRGRRGLPPGRRATADDQNIAGCSITGSPPIESGFKSAPPSASIRAPRREPVSHRNSRHARRRRRRHARGRRTRPRSATPRGRASGREP